jgi:hypothetical protein
MRTNKVNANMLISGNTVVTKDPHQGFNSIGSFLCSGMIAMVCWLIASDSAAAQIPVGVAQVTKTGTGAIYYSQIQGPSSSSPLTKGTNLKMGDVIETVGGRVVLALSDGSQVIIYERSRVELRDFRPGHTPAELLEVFVGRIRAVINHQGKRPSPYRLYSPVASIAVRGTDFQIEVEPTKETRVLVYEGLVEVGSRLNQQNPVLVKPGRNVVVRPGGDIGLISSGPGSQLNGVANVRGLGFTYDVKAYSSDFVSYRLNDQVTFFPLRFTAFSDSHFDSLQNPAFASDFTGADGRLYFLYSISRPSLTRRTGEATSRIEPADFFNNTASGQSSFFTPIGDSRIVIGGSFAISNTALKAENEWETSYTFRGSPDVVSMYQEHQEVDSKLRTYDASFLVARRFGSGERLSLGVKLDYLSQGTAFASMSRGQFDEALDNRQRIRVDKSQRGLDRYRLTVGVTRRFAKEKRVGAFYRRGILTESIRRKEFSDTCKLRACLDDDDQAGDFSADQNSSEIGLLFRGSINRKFFYGLDGGLFLRNRTQMGAERLLYYIDNGRIRVIGPDTQSPELQSQLDIDGKSFRGGGGLGYALRENTVFSFDLSGGSERYELKYKLNGIPYDLEKIPRRNFITLHAGMQTEVRSRFLANLSFLYTNGCCSTINPLISSTDLTRSQPSRYINLGVGWRIKPNWIGQYVYSSDFKASLPSHTLMFRYDFGRKRE